MSRVESGFVPLPKVEQEQPEENIKIRLNLPDYVDQDRIGVNLTGITKLNDWGGIGRLIVVGKTDMDTSSESLEVNGVNSDGSASASKKVTKVNVPVYDSFSVHDGIGYVRIADRWKYVGVRLNIDEMAQRVKEKPEGVRSPKSWAKELDSGIKQPIRAEGHQNLIHDLRSGDKIDIALIATFGSAINALIIASGGSFHPIYYSGAYFGDRLAELRKASKRKDYRFSLIPGYQLDRAAILSVTSRLKTVVKDLHQEE